MLVLSEFAGAAEQLQAALLVNPHDIAAHRRRDPPRAVHAARGAARALAGARSRRCASRTSPGGGASFLEALDATAGRGVSLGDLEGLAPRRRTTRSSSTSTARWPRSAPTPTRSASPPATAAALDAAAPPARRRGGDPERPRPPRPRPAHARRRSGAPAATGSRSSRRAPRCRRRRAPLPEAVLAPLRAAARTPGVRLELKGPVAALHYRAAPEAEAACLAAAGGRGRRGARARRTRPARWWSRSSPPRAHKGARPAPPRRRCRPSPAAAR